MILHAHKENCMFFGIVIIKKSFLLPLFCLFYPIFTFSLITYSVFPVVLIILHAHSFLLSNPNFVAM